MNESETRAELIDPQLKSAGWGEVEGSRILRERDVCKITDGKIQSAGRRGRALIADYILVYKGIKLAIVEAKSSTLEVGEGVAQAKLYAQKLNLDTTFATNGKEIYQICMKTGKEGLVSAYPTPEQLWEKAYSSQTESENPAGLTDVEKWRDAFNAIPFEDRSGTWTPRYYQEIAVKNTLEAISQGKDRILLTLATGTGKTAIAFQIAWKLFHTRWNLNRDGKRRPRILFLADRNILANQAFNSFSAFPEDALVRITPKEIKKRGKVPTNGSIFFTIFQSLMANDNTADNEELEDQNECNFDDPTAYYNQYPKDYFDLIIIDECHRGGANDESTWRGILDYFTPAVQLGLTATPKRKNNVDTYAYFGDPVYIYSLKDGINDGFLTPFKVKRIKTTMDDYVYTADDDVLEGEVEEGKTYSESEFNRKIEIRAREAKRVKIFMDDALSRGRENDKTIIFCAIQQHAALIRDLVNQYNYKRQNKNADPHYCVRVTADDGKIGEQFLRVFQDNEKLIPTILTTSKKLSTGVDARNVRNIVLMRPVNQIIEFKQIVGRGTRLFEGKSFFTIYDFVDASLQFSDPEWDGEPLEPEPSIIKEPDTIYDPNPNDNQDDLLDDFADEGQDRPKKIKIKLRDGKEREIQHMMQTMFWSPDGKPMTAEAFLNNLFGDLPALFKDEAELRQLWSNPKTRLDLLARLAEAGYNREALTNLKRVIEAEESDLFDVLEYVFNSDRKPITRVSRVRAAHAEIFGHLNDKQKEFIDFVLKKYVEAGVDELSQEKLPILLTSKYQSLPDAISVLGDVGDISNLFIDFQQYLYAPIGATTRVAPTGTSKF